MKLQRIAYRIATTDSAKKNVHEKGEVQNGRQSTQRDQFSTTSGASTTMDRLLIGRPKPSSHEPSESERVERDLRTLALNSRILKKESPVRLTSQVAQADGDSARKVINNLRS